MKVCVFCSSSDYVDEQYFEAARDLGTLLSSNNFHLVYGGTDVGLMGALAKSMQEGEGQITGVIPKFIFQKGIAYEGCNKLMVTRDMRERKATMESLSDAFIALPGGFGTLEELMEIITLKQLMVHAKPIVLVNTGGFFNPLNGFFDQVYHQGFASERFRELMKFVPNVWEAIKYIKSYRPITTSDKWSK